MRHRVYGKKLGRDKNQRATLFRGLMQSLFTHGTIQTSEVKAKAIKGMIDKVINLAKDKRTHSKVHELLNDKNLTDRLIKEIVPKINNRTSGYTSLTRLKTRFGDQTMMVKMSIIGAEELKPIEKESRVKNQESRKEDKEQSKVKKELANKTVKKIEATKVAKERSKKS